MDKLGKKKIALAAGALALALAVIGGIALVLAGGGKNVITAWINVPEQAVEEDLGTYLLPEYEVVDRNGMILAGYQVSLLSAQGPGGEAVDASWGSVMVDSPGTYEFVYTAGVDNVEDAVLQVDFRDRTAPSVKLTGVLPDFYITGNTYKMPAYSVEGDAEMAKCWAKVFYISESGEEEAVEVKSNQFPVDRTDGSYAIRIHVEDSAGNFNDYEYIRVVDGPEHFDADTVLYFAEEFGARQVEVLEGDKYSGTFVSKEEEPERVYEGTDGSYKLTFNGEETQANEGYVVMKTPAILDISSCREMEMYVYNDSGMDVIMGSRWWNDQPVKAGEWTRVVWPVNGWGGEVGNVGVDNIRTISAMDISGTVIRVIFDYGGEVVPQGSFYFSPMKVSRRGESELIAGEHVLLDRTTYWQGDTVQLRAEAIEGKVVDCFLADDIPLTGDTFIPTKETHTITVRYVDELNLETMTWGTYSYDPEWWGNEAWLEGNLCVAKGLNAGTDWALSFDVTGGYDGNLETNQLFEVAVMVGAEHIIEFQVNHYSDSVCKWYGEGAWEDTVGVLSPDVVERFMEASPENPANVLAVRRGGDLYLFVDEFFIGKTSVGDKPLRGDWFGYAARVEQKGVKTPSIRNLRAVSGEERTGFVYEARKYYLQVGEYDAMEVIDGDTYQAPAAQVMDVEGNPVKGVKARLTAVTEGGDKLMVGGRSVTIPYGGAVNLKLSWQARHPEGAGTLTAAARMTVQRSDGVIMEPANMAVATIDPDGNEVAFDGSRFHGDDQGSIRVTAKEGDVAVYLNMFDFTGYDYVDFWVYTERENTLSGSYWLGDTLLKPGKWTRVRIKLADENVYLKDSTGNDFCPNKWHKGQPYIGRLALRFMGEGCGEGAQFWVSTVQAGTYGPVTVHTKNCSTDRSEYMQGDIIHLNPDCAPEGMILDYFSINGERTDALSFEALDREYEIEAFYRPKNTVLYINEYGVESLEPGSNRVEYDRNIRHGDDEGSVKITLSGNDNGVFLRSYNFSGYDYVEFYVYTNARKLQAGAWWCGDMPLRAGKWTRVRIKLNAENLMLQNLALGDLWPNKDGGTAREGRMITRFFGSGCEAGTEVWLSSVRAYRNEENQDGSDPIMAVDAAADEVGLFYDAKSAAYTTERAYDGNDRLVTGSENGSLKVTVGGPEAGVCVAGACIDDISRYDEVYFYVYTDVKGAQSGGWWCGDTPLRPGQWTKVTLTKEMGPQNLAGESIFTATPNNFAYRFMGGRDGDVFYVTSLYAVKKPASDEVRVEAEGVTTDKEVYKKGETVTLAARTPAPAGLETAFVVNGKVLSGNSFVVEDTGRDYRVTALYRDPDTAGVPVLGAGAEQIAFQDAAEAQGYGTEKVYDGDDRLVRACETGSLKVQLTGPEAAVCVSNELVGDISGFDCVYFYAYTDAVGIQAGGWWCGDTALTPGQWTKVTLPKTTLARAAVGPWNLHGEPIFEVGPDLFAYRFMGGKPGDVLYVTSLYAQMAQPEPVEGHITLLGCATDKDSYKRGETVTLTAAAAPAGLELGGFLIDGERIDGNTFVYAGGGRITAEAWYRRPDTKAAKVNDLHRAALGDGCIVGDVTDGITSYGMDSSRAYDGDDAAVRQGDAAGTLKLTATKDEAAFSVSGAVMNDISGYDQVYYYAYTDNAGVKVGGWWCGDTELTRGAWTKVVMPKVNTVAGTPPWNDKGVSIFEAGPDGFVYRLMSVNGGATVYVTSLYGENLPVDSVADHMTLLGCTTDKDGYKGGETVTLTAAAAPAGLELGGFLIDGERIDGNTFVYAGGGRITAEAWYRRPDTKAAKVNDLHRAALGDGCIVGDVTDGITGYGMDSSRTYDGDDAAVRQGDAAGTLKLTATKNEAAFSVSGAVMSDISGYDQVYYYAYTDNAGVKVGGWWCGDTELTRGAWTKVVMPKVNTVAGTPPWNDKGVSIFEAGPDGFVYRLMSVNGGATVYVTSLYGENLPVDSVADHMTLLGCTTDKDGYKGGETVTLTAANVPSGLEAAGFVVNGKKLDGNTFIYESGKTYTIQVWYRNPATGGGKVLDVNGGQISPQHDGGTAEYVTEKIYDGADELVKASDAGLMKVTVGGGEAGFSVSNALVNDISGYDQIYFYVYTEAQGTQSGGWWCGDTNLTPGQWTKVTLTKGMGPKNLADQSVFDAGPDGFVYRFMKAPAGTVFYVTSLYAEMKPAPVKANDIHSAALGDSYSDGVTAAMDSAKAYDGDDTLVKEGDKAGSLALTVTKADAAFSVPGGVADDISGYDQVYYYAYTDVAGVTAGGWWCGDTVLTPGQWTKVVLPKNVASNQAPPQNKDGQNIFDAGPNHCIYRIQYAGGTAVVYVTSIYAEYTK